jgi:hypothetical protein
MITTILMILIGKILQLKQILITLWDGKIIGTELSLKELDMSVLTTLRLPITYKPV